MSESVAAAAERRAAKQSECTTESVLAGSKASLQAFLASSAAVGASVAFSPAFKRATGTGTRTALVVSPAFFAFFLVSEHTSACCCAEQPARAQLTLPLVLPADARSRSVALRAPQNRAPRPVKARRRACAMAAAEETRSGGVPTRADAACDEQPPRPHRPPPLLHLAGAPPGRCAPSLAALVSRLRGALSSAAASEAEALLRAAVSRCPASPRCLVREVTYAVDAEEREAPGSCDGAAAALLRLTACDASAPAAAEAAARALGPADWARALCGGEGEASRRRGAAFFASGFAPDGRHDRGAATLGAHLLARRERLWGLISWRGGGGGAGTAVAPSATVIRAHAPLHVASRPELLASLDGGTTWDALCACGEAERFLATDAARDALVAHGAALIRFPDALAPMLGAMWIDRHPGMRALVADRGSLHGASPVAHAVLPLLPPPARLRVLAALGAACGRGSGGGSGGGGSGGGGGRRGESESSLSPDTALDWAPFACVAWRSVADARLAACLASPEAADALFFPSDARDGTQSVDGGAPAATPAAAELAAAADAAEAAAAAADAAGDGSRGGIGGGGDGGSVSAEEARLRLLARLWVLSRRLRAPPRAASGSIGGRDVDVVVVAADVEAPPHAPIDGAWVASSILASGGGVTAEAAEAAGEGGAGDARARRRKDERRRKRKERKRRRRDRGGCGGGGASEDDGCTDDEKEERQGPAAGAETAAPSAWRCNLDEWRDPHDAHSLRRLCVRAAADAWLRAALERRRDAR